MSRQPTIREWDGKEFFYPQEDGYWYNSDRSKKKKFDAKGEYSGLLFDFKDADGQPVFNGDIFYLINAPKNIEDNFKSASALLIDCHQKGIKFKIISSIYEEILAKEK